MAEPAAPERVLAQELLSTSTLQEARGLLARHAGRCRPDVLLRELDALRARLTAAGRPAEAALAEFHRRTVQDLQGFLAGASDHAGRLRQHGRTWPLGYPEPVDEPRALLEQDATRLMQRGDLDGAMAVLRRAGAIAPRPEEVPRLAGLRMTLAHELRSRGRSGEALAVLDTVDFGPRSGGALAGDAVTDQLRTRFQRLRGLLCDDNGAYEEARNAFQQAVDAAQAHGDLESQYHAHTDLAASYLKAGRTREGVREFRRVLAFVEAKGGRLIGVLNNLGAAYAQAGDADAARSCYQRSLRLSADEGGEGLSVVNALLGVGDLAWDAGNVTEAGELYFQALLKSMSRDTRVVAEGMALVVSRAEKMGADGEALLATAETFKASLPGTFTGWHTQLTFRLAQARRRERAGQPEQAIADLRELHAEAVRQSADVQLRLLVTEHLAETLLRRPRPQEAFDVLWDARAGLLRARSAGQDTPALVALHHRIYESLITLLLDGGLRLPESAPRLAFDLHEEYKTWTGATGADPATFAAVRDCLRTHPDAPTCAYLSYFCGTRGLIAFAYVPRHDRLGFARSPVTTRTLRQAAERLRRTFDGDPDAFPPQAPLPARRPWKRDLGFFDDLAPDVLAILPQASECELLCVAADGPLHDLPLHALPLPGEGRPVVERHAVVLVGSAADMLRLATAPPADGNPAVYVAAVAAREDPDPGRLENDAELIGRPVTADSGIAATPDTVAGGLRGASVAHLAGHGWFDPAEPMDSGVFLAHDGRRPPRHPHTVDVRTRLDHLLTARRLARERLRLDVLTLRACSTARRDAHSTGYLEGIVQALLQAGARTVVATLWDVDDASSRRLFAGFYRNLLDGDRVTPPWRALWEAQRAMARDPDRPWETHPYHWAAPALFGAWRQA
ncbi:MAG: hypothetical protein QOI78_5538 [Actinomycetota bacterium]|nr:hypothetical protein [Actinomycetota bacterium]